MVLIADTEPGWVMDVIITMGTGLLMKILS